MGFWKVDRYLYRFHTAVQPFLNKLQGRLENEIVNLAHKAIFLKKRHKFSQRKHPLLWIDPPKQGLRSGQTLMLQLVFRLKIHTEMACLQSLLRLFVVSSVSVPVILERIAVDFQMAVPIMAVRAFLPAVIGAVQRVGKGILLPCGLVRSHRQK